MQLKATYGSIWNIAYPIILGSLAPNIIGLMDTIFLGRVGEIEQGACGLISLYYLIPVMLGLGLSRGAQILIARRAGEKRDERIGIVASNLLYMEMFGAVVLFVIVNLFTPYILYILISSQAVYDASLVYLKYRVYGLPFSFFAFVAMALYMGIGRTYIIAWVMGISCIVNVFLDYALIFGTFGFPEMGIAGAGLASTIAEVVATMFALAYMLYDKNIKRFNIFEFRKPQFPLIRHIAVISSPLMVQYLIGMGGWFIFLSLIEKMGERALAISVVLKIIYTFYSAPAWGFASAANSLVSNIIGQRKYKQVLVAINRSTILSFVTTVVPCATLVFFPELILSIFTKDLEVILGAKSVILVLIMIILACSISNVIFNGIMGTGATFFSLVTETFSMFVYLGYAYIIVNALDLGLKFVWGSEFIYWLLLVIIGVAYLKSGKWKKVTV
ncbi:MAG: MATE family efflux transporter [Chitinophagales bacterium]